MGLGFLPRAALQAISQPLLTRMLLMILHDRALRIVQSWDASLVDTQKSRGQPYNGDEPTKQREQTLNCMTPMVRRGQQMSVVRPVNENQTPDTKAHVA